MTTMSNARRMLNQNEKWNMKQREREIERKKLSELERKMERVSWRKLERERERKKKEATNLGGVTVKICLGGRV